MNSNKEESYKHSTKDYIVMHIGNAIKKVQDKSQCHKHYKPWRFLPDKFSTTWLLKNYSLLATPTTVLLLTVVGRHSLFKDCTWYSPLLSILLYVDIHHNTV